MAAASHIAAIHVLKAKLRLTDDDYRALLGSLTGKTSSADMTFAERGRVRDHLQRLAERMGVAATRARPLTGQQFARKKSEASPKERKVWALWNQLHREGMVRDASPKALTAFVRRTVRMDALGWCNDAQLNTLIEALKEWIERGRDVRDV